MRNACYYFPKIMANDEGISEKQTGSTEEVDTSYGRITCSVCFDPIIDPVVFPCKHEVCEACFHKNLRAANFYCPICRLRISSWARKRIKDPVDKKRRKELASATSSAVDESSSVLSRRIATPGEIHKEYMYEKKVVDKEREEECNLGWAEAVRIAQLDHQLVIDQLAKDEEVAVKLAKSIEQEDLARQDQESLDSSYAEWLASTQNIQNTPTRVTKAKPLSNSSKKKKSSVGSKLKGTQGTLPISIWLKPKASSSTSTEDETVSCSSLTSDKQIEMDYKIALELQQKWEQK